jgi:hypothetical protein
MNISAPCCCCCRAVFLPPLGVWLEVGCTKVSPHRKRRGGVCTRDHAAVHATIHV